MNPEVNKDLWKTYQQIYEERKESFDLDPAKSYVFQIVDD